MKGERTRLATLRDAEHTNAEGFMRGFTALCDWMAEPLDQQIARARREMGEARWQELNREWEA